MPASCAPLHVPSNTYRIPIPSARLFWPGFFLRCSVGAALLHPFRWLGALSRWISGCSSATAGSPTGDVAAAAPCAAPYLKISPLNPSLVVLPFTPYCSHFCLLCPALRLLRLCRCPTFGRHLSLARSFADSARRPSASSSASSCAAPSSHVPPLASPPAPRRHAYAPSPLQRLLAACVHGPM